MKNDLMLPYHKVLKKAAEANDARPCLTFNFEKSPDIVAELQLNFLSDLLNHFWDKTAELQLEMMIGLTCV